MPEGIEARDVKFLGVVQSYNEAKKFGMVASDEAQALWGQEIYAYKDVLATVGAQVGDTIRFGVHVNPRGQPQVSLPVWKIGPDGLPIGGIPEGTTVYNAEELAAEDPSFMESLKAEIEGRSAAQNQKRGRMGGDANGFGAKRAKGAPRGGDWGGPEAFAWGGGGGAGWGAPPPALAGGGGGGWGSEVTLFVSGLPPGVERREVMHIFRQYAGFTSLRLVTREDHTICFVSFATPPQGQFVAEALNGYVFDEEAPPDQQTVLTLQPAKEKKRT